MTLTSEACTASSASRGKPLGGTVAERLGRITPIVDDLRAADPAAERDRVLQYDAVTRCTERGSWPCGFRSSTADRAAASAMCSRR